MWLFSLKTIERHFTVCFDGQGGSNFKFCGRNPSVGDHLNKSFVFLFVLQNVAKLLSLILPSWVHLRRKI